MTKKLRLDLEAVVVESFPTVASRTEMLGTVEAREAGESLIGGGECTLADGCSGDAGCSTDMGCSREDCSEFCTGYPGCSEDGVCSAEPRCTGIGVCYWTP